MNKQKCGWSILVKILCLAIKCEIKQFFVCKKPKQNTQTQTHTQTNDNGIYLYK